MSRFVELRGRRELVDALCVAVVALVAIARLGVEGAGLVGLGVLVGITLTLRIHLPRGGSIPMGHAVVIALAFQRSSVPFALVCCIALVTARAASAVVGRDDWSGRPAAGAVAGMLAAGVVAAVVHPYVPSREADNWAQAALLSVLAIGVAHVAAEILVEGRSFAQSWRAATPIYLSLVSSAALIAMASDWLLVFAALPLVITWYSFERYSAARRTYEQTIQALGIVPELAGHVTIGHGERCAAYVRALAEGLELPIAHREHAVVAARLHHVGHVAIPDRADSKQVIDDSAVAVASAHILRDSGFLPEIADLVGSLAVPGADDIVAATLRVASAFDDLVGEDEERARGALAILQSRAEGPAWSTVVGALRALVDDEHMVGAAIAEGAPLTAAAAAAAASGALSR